jgi:signal transduction histidine kinase
MSAGPDQTSPSTSPPPWIHLLASAEKMERLDRLANLGLLSAGMAHEIKNGMVAIQTFVDLLLEKNPDTELGGVVRQELQRINTIVTQMLRMATPGQATLKPVRVHEVLDHSLRLLQPHIAGRLISLKKEFRAGSDLVQGDDAQLQQAFLNLLLNAFEAMGPNGTLTVSTENADGENGARSLQVQIRDTGIGIAPENLARLFEPFFTTKKSGTGLGLAISLRIINEHQGSIRAHGEAGKGSTFTISLPAGAA